MPMPPVMDLNNRPSVRSAARANRRLICVGALLSLPIFGGCTELLIVPFVIVSVPVAVVNNAINPVGKPAHSIYSIDAKTEPKLLSRHISESEHQCGPTTTYSATAVIVDFELDTVYKKSSSHMYAIVELRHFDGFKNPNGTVIPLDSTLKRFAINLADPLTQTIRSGYTVKLTINAWHAPEPGFEVTHFEVLDVARTADHTIYYPSRMMYDNATITH